MLARGEAGPGREGWTMMDLQLAEAPFFMARLESSTASAGTMFVSGDFDDYGIDMLGEKARYGVDSVRIRVDGVGRVEAEQRLARGLAQVLRRGVKVYISAN